MKRVRATLTKLDNVKGVSVDFKAKTAKVTAGGKLSRATIAQALKGAGYGVSSFDRVEPPKKYLVSVTGMT